MPFWVCGWWLAVTYCWVFLQHSASMARVLAEAGPPGEEEPVPTLRLFRQAEQLGQHEHILRQQHTRECPLPACLDWLAPHMDSLGSGSKKRCWDGLRWGVGLCRLFATWEPNSEALDILELRQDSQAQNELDCIHREGILCDLVSLYHWGGRYPPPPFLRRVCTGMCLCDARLVWKPASLLGLERELLKGIIEGDYGLKWSDMGWVCPRLNGLHMLLRAAYWALGNLRHV